MAIPPEVRLARIKIWRDVFTLLQERYRKEGQTINWSGGQEAAQNALDRLWERYERDVEDVRAWLMDDGDHRMQWRKKERKLKPRRF